uniref:SSD domain-containing protein n=1 Tax=Heterorhabditis bacteriophora TaxID=37862 RepID=A0A1I7XI35_HETBA
MNESCDYSKVAYTDLCMSFDWACYLNDHLTMLMPKSRWGNFSGPIAELASDIINKEVNITYPIGWRGSEPIYFGALVGRTHLVDEEGHFDYASAVRLTYNVREEKDVADALTPKFIGTCSILFTFCFMVSVVLMKHDNGLLGIDWVRSKPIVACAGIWCPLLAIVTSFGLLLWFGELYNAIVNVSPFLVLCIGIDDLFIMSAEWHRTSPNLSPARRIAETLSEAAVAITITSITDILTFFSPILAYAAEMEDQGRHSLLFKKALDTKNAASNWKLFFLAGSVSRQAESCKIQAIKQSTLETNGKKKHGKGWKSKINKIVNRLETRLEPHDHKKRSLFSQIYPVGCKLVWTTKLKLLFNVEDDLDRMKLVLKKQMHMGKGRITPVHSEVHNICVCALLLYLIYMGLAIIGCLNIKEGLDPKFLVRESFYLSNFYKLIDETFWMEGLQMQVVVNRPPDLFDPVGRADFAKMMSDFEQTHYTMSHNATMIWLNAYESHLNKEQEELNIEKPKK